MVDHRRAPRPRQRISGHETQDQRFRGNPSRKPANSGDVAQRLYSLLKLEVPEIFLNDIRHCHSQRSCKILRRHIALFVFIAQET
jgi:hypothetical protein